MRRYRDLLLSALIVAFAGCAATPDPSSSASSPNVYGDATPLSTVMPVAPTYKESLASIDPYEVATVTLSTTNVVGFGMSEATIIAEFAPRDNTLHCQLSFAGSKYSFILDPRDRAYLISTITTYLAEFEARKLVNEKNKDSAYGSVPVSVKWGMITQSAMAEPIVRVGYIFNKRTPYYTLTFPETKNVLFETYGSRVQFFSFMRWFMTRSQAQAFGDILDQKFLESTLANQNLPAGSSDPDEY